MCACVSPDSFVAFWIHDSKPEDIACAHRKFQHRIKHCDGSGEVLGVQQDRCLKLQHLEFEFLVHLPKEQNRLAEVLRGATEGTAARRDLTPIVCVSPKARARSSLRHAFDISRSAAFMSLSSSSFGRSRLSCCQRCQVATTR